MGSIANVQVSVTNPDDENGTDVPIYEGPLVGAHDALTSGVYSGYTDGCDGEPVDVAVVVCQDHVVLVFVEAGVTFTVPARVYPVGPA